jgi:4,5-dihydroxyphthalate decarboxylase
MLEAGELDAAFPALPRALADGSPNVAPLFPDFGDVERAYFRKTGIFPIMHVVVVQRELYEANPWMAVSLAKAFEEARALAMRRLVSSHGPLHASVPWLNEAIRSSVDTLGPDFWSYGLQGNEHVIETLARYLFEQGLIRAPIEDVGALFAQETRRGFQAQPA